jgi:hypothetical protein
LAAAKYTIGPVVIPDWLKPVLTFFEGLAWVGLALSILSHAAAFFGSQGPLGNYEWLLHIGIFVVWLPTVLVASRLSAEFKQKDMWKATLRGCPAWMRYMVYGFFGYALLNFVVFMAAGPRAGAAGPMPPIVVRGFSGHWMAFYSAAAAALYSATHAAERDKARRCVNGHAVGPLARFCEQCGLAVIDATPHA